jgi:hypothetical protein
LRCRGRFQVLFEELTEPALLEHEMDVDALLTGGYTPVAKPLTPAIGKSLARKKANTVLQVGTLTLVPEP